MSTDARPGRASIRLSARTIVAYAIGSLGTGRYATLPGLVLTYFLMALGILPLSRYRLRRTDIERAEVGPPPGAPA